MPVLRASSAIAMSGRFWFDPVTVGPMSTYSFTRDIPVRFRDIDNSGNVNHIVFASYMEQVRGEYYADVLDLVLSEVPTVIVHLSVEYERPIAPRDTVTAAMRIPELGTSSLPMEYELRTDAGVVATGKTVQVVTDPEAGDPAPIPDDWRERIETFESW